jgi:iron complex transport system ATP-binding protein
MSLLEIKEISCGYDNADIIKNISFSVEKGSFIGVIGPNGAGKTTLFRAITRALALRKGSVLYNGTDLLEIPAKTLARHMAVIPQIIFTPVSFTVEEFVSMGRFAYTDRFSLPADTDRDAVRGAMELANIVHLKDRSIRELSGGERQQAYLAQGFAQTPEILLLDEPTAHLDIRHQAAIMDVLKKLNKEQGLTVVVILHDLNLAAGYCNEIILLNEGKIYRKGGADEILNSRTIEEVYRTPVVVEKNPITGKPYIFLKTAA